MNKSINSPFISIIVPVYNAESWLDRCVTSLVEQTFSDIEIVLVDDGSSDNSLRFCNEWKSKDSRIVVTHQENSGVSSTRNHGLKISKGQFVAFVDADDWIDNNVCETFFDAYQKNNCDLFCYSAVYHQAKKSIVTFLFGNDIDLMNENQKMELHCKVMTPNAPWYSCKVNTRFTGSACGKFYKASTLKQNLLAFSTQTIISEDCLFNIYSIDYFERICFSKRVFYHYQILSDSAQNCYRPNSMKYFEFVINSIQKWLIEKQKSTLFIDSANTLFVHYLFGALKEDYFHFDNNDKLNSCVKLKNILSQKKYQTILFDAPKGYFSYSERVLLFLLKRKMISVLRFLILAYNKWIS